MKAIALSITSCAILAFHLSQPATAAEMADSLYLTHATIIDGTGAGAQPNMTILLDGGLIAAIFEDGSQPLDDSVATEDVSGHFVIPGLIDNHMHATDGQAEDLHKLVQEGITTIRDPSTHARDVKKLLDAVPDGMVVPLIHHGPIFAGPNFGEGFHSIESTSDIGAMVKEVAAAGSTGIKIYTDLTSEQIHELAQAARDNDLAVWSHLVVKPASWRDTIEAGVTILSHASFRDERLSPEELDERLNLIKKRGAFLDATLRVVQYEMDSDEVRQNFYDTTRRANELGVMIVAGTDDSLQDLWERPGGMGYADGRAGLFEELELLVEKSGLTPMQALQTATSLGAKALGLDSKLGTVEVGKAADLVVLAANPLDDISNTRKIAIVFKDAQRVEPLTLE